MGIDVLYFDGSAIGDMLLAIEPATHALTPPVRREGVFHEFGAVDSASRNILYGRLFYLHLLRSDNAAAADAIDLIQSLIGLVGDLVVMRDDVTRMTFLGWTIDDVSRPRLEPGFGGRLTTDLVVTAVGTTRPIPGEG